MEIDHIIGQTPLFEGLEKHHLEELSNIAASKTYKRGEIIFSEGEPGNGFYIVGHGKVKIFKLSFAGKEQILHIYGPGKPFGEVPVFTGKHFPASAMAITNTTLLFFPRDAFVTLIGENPSLSLNMMAVLSMRLRQFTVMVENLSLKDVPARLASYLLLLTKEQNSTTSVNLPVSKNQLAGLMGTTPESVSRVFNRFAAEGCIQVDRNCITIIDVDALAEISESTS